MAAGESLILMRNQRCTDHTEKLLKKGSLEPPHLNSIINERVTHWVVTIDESQSISIMIRWLVLSLSRAVQPRCKPVNQKKMDSMRPSFYEFKTNYDSQPEKWKKRLMAIYKTDQEAAIAAWTLIMSMDDLMLEVEETAIFLNQIYSKN